MIFRIFFIIILFVLNSCYQTTSSLIGPTITLGTSGNLAQSAISYSVNDSVKKVTGHYPAEHLKKRLKN